MGEALLAAEEITMGVLGVMVGTAAAAPVQAAAVRQAEAPAGGAEGAAGADVKTGKQGLPAAQAITGQMVRLVRQVPFLAGISLESREVRGGMELGVEGVKVGEEAQDKEGARAGMEQELAVEGEAAAVAAAPAVPAAGAAVVASLSSSGLMAAVVAL